MGEFPGDEVSHGDEVLDAAIAAGASACLLKGSIHRFDTAVVFAGFEAVERDTVYNRVKSVSNL